VHGGIASGLGANKTGLGVIARQVIKSPYVPVYKLMGSYIETSSADFDAGTKSNTATSNDQYALAAGAVGLAFPYAVKDASLLSYWRFENNLLDQTGRTALVNNDCVYSADGRFGGCYTYPADEGYMNAGDDYDWETTGMTYAFWAELDALPRDNLLFAKYNSVSEDAIAHFYNEGAGGVAELAWDTFSEGVAEEVPVETGKWYLHVVTVDTAANSYRMRMYRDAVEKGTSRTASLPSTGGYDFYIGAFLEEGEVDFGFSGKIDEFKIYNRCLTQAEITTLYNANKQYKNLGLFRTQARTIPAAYGVSQVKVTISGADATHRAYNWSITRASSGATLATSTSNLTTNGTHVLAGWNNALSDITGAIKLGCTIIGDYESTLNLEETEIEYSGWV